MVSLDLNGVLHAVDVDGTAVFGIDSQPRGLLHAAIARPTAFGAKPTAINRAAAEAEPGVTGVFEIDRGIGVCARTLEAAWRGRDASRAGSRRIATSCCAASRRSTSSSGVSSSGR